MVMAYEVANFTYVSNLLWDYGIFGLYQIKTCP